MVALRTDERVTTRGYRRRVAVSRGRMQAVEPPLPRVRSDGLPEVATYRDTGCSVSATCLGCPLPRCLYDEPASARRRLLLDARDREIAMIRRRYAAPIRMIASAYRLDERTVYRILAAARAVATPRQTGR